MSNPRVWQIACGEAGRRYDDLFLKYDVMFLGPGRFGPYARERYEDGQAKEFFSAQKIGQVRSFATEVKPGHFALLRSGHKALAIGIVAEEGYRHNDTFDDVYGWDLHHTQRVLWQHQLSGELEAVQADADLFSDRKQIPTFTRVNDARILQPLGHLLAKCSSRDLTDLPKPPPAPLSLAELGDALFAKGLSYAAMQQVQAALEKQRRLISWYGRPTLSPRRPTEHEVVAHVILPLMLALGWAEQLLALEWHKIDLAAFWDTPTDKERCKLVCEAKVMGHGLQDVLGQATKYVDKLGLAACDKILLADGGRFYLYRKERGRWCEEPSGYMNVMKIREAHLCPANTNAVDTLIALTPARVAT